MAWSPQGQVVASYEKNHLVPFGEYVPGRSFLKHFFNLTDVPEDAIRGHAPGFLRTPAGPLAVMISYEVFFDDLARRGVRAGGQLLVVPTNTASYRSTEVPTEELAASELKARETGRWLAQVSTTGYTAFITPDGRVTERTRLGDPSVITATVALRSGQTVYVRWGDWAVFAVAAAALLGAVAFNLRRRNDRSRHPV
jgi:apolipoprotein N-acyltransferase